MCQVNDRVPPDDQTEWMELNTRMAKIEHPASYCSFDKYRNFVVEISRRCSSLNYGSDVAASKSVPLVGTPHSKVLVDGLPQPVMEVNGIHNIPPNKSE